MEPASIRFNNPGAMWDGPSAKRWGSNARVILADGEGNHIAVFPDKVHGAAAQFDLWKRNYAGMTLASAIRKWSGGNSPSAYMAFLAQRTGIAAGDKVTPSLLAGPKGLALMKAQAHWEAGRPYPLTDAEWAQAQRMVFSGNTASGGVVAAAAVSGAVVAIHSGVPIWAVLTVAAAVAAGIGAFIWYRSHTP